MTLAARTLLGWDADLWAAIGAISVPFTIAIVGVWWGRFQQQARWASERFHVDGIQKLFGALSRLLSTHLQNYQIATYIIRTVRSMEHGHPVAPQPEDIPRFLGQEFESLPIDALLPVQELLGNRVILDWVMIALSDVTLEAKEFEFQIRQPTAAYYRQPVNLDRKAAIEGLTAVVEAWNTRVSTHFALLDRLNDLDRHLGTKRPWTQAGYYAVKRRTAIKGLVSEMKTGLDTVQKARADTESILKSGGGTA